PATPGERERDAPAPLTPPPPSAPPRAIGYPLVSVIAADGEVHPEERALVDRFLEGEGLPPLADHEFRVHHPSEVAHLVPTERREDVVKLMCETASIDGMPDESERRVIRAYATAWHVDDEKLDFWMWGYESMNTSLARQLFLKLRRFVLSARWSDDETKER
ncbi:MAG: TerB family tellurite resistance protein, partial [Labilithrix sp.]|nr:TerB family tellurite resistance protein [Labilithrix sp.]